MPKTILNHNIKNILKTIFNLIIKYTKSIINYGTNNKEWKQLNEKNNNTHTSSNNKTVSKKEKRK